jgi:translation initiation factor 2B subunit (eIF-2B alpha/beta/delta family)
VDARLDRALEQIAADRRSGAAELARQGVVAVEQWLGRERNPSGDALLELARRLLHAQPTMAPLVRLANEVALALDAPNPSARLTKELAGFKKVLDTGVARMARPFRAAIRKGSGPMATYSYSSTVIELLKSARQRYEFALCSESRPDLEGRATASALVEAGVDVVFVADAVLASHMFQAEIFVTGADALLPWGFVNKAGTAAMIYGAMMSGTAVWVVADTSKLVPKELAPLVKADFGGKPTGLWDEAPGGVTCLNILFETVDYLPGIRVLTERGWRKPIQLQREFKRIRVSPRLRELASAAPAPEES